MSDLASGHAGRGCTVTRVPLWFVSLKSTGQGDITCNSCRWSSTRDPSPGPGTRSSDTGVDPVSSRRRPCLEPLMSSGDGRNPSLRTLRGVSRISVTTHCRSFGVPLAPRRVGTSTSQSRLTPRTQKTMTPPLTPGPSLLPPVTQRVNPKFQGVLQLKNDFRFS